MSGIEAGILLFQCVQEKAGVMGLEAADAFAFLFCFFVVHVYRKRPM